MMMSSKTKSQLIAENSALQARIAKLEAAIANGLQERDELVENDQANGTHNRSALEASENRYRRLFETAQDGIIILDARTGKIEDANPFLENLIGYTQSELQGKSLWEIGLFKDVEANLSMYRELKEKGYVRYENLPLQTKMGSLRQVEFVSNIYLVSRRRVIQCNIRDISARKEAEAKAKQIHDELVTSLAELHRNEKELQSLYDMNDLLQSCNSQDEAYQVIRMLGSELFGEQSGGLAILRPNDQYLEVVMNWGVSDFMVPNFHLNDCWAIRRGQLHIVDDPQTGLICQHFSRPLQTGYFCIPLMVQGETLGMLCITNPAGDKRRQRQQQLAVIVGDSIKLSLSNLRLWEKLREQALTDQLTGLGNRHYLEDSLSRELARTLRRKASVCVAMLDLDHFKKFNDTHGHDAGDMLLRKLGELLIKNLRQTDIITRYGGEEFVVVQLDSTLTDVRGRLEKIRELVKEITIERDNEKFGGVSISIGIVEAHDSDWTARKLIRAADEAMYAAKKAGRDCIVIYPA
jgi:diguanylate cyclase (GGDEF)-like protein/PAS domain S-box-containing protein